MYKILHIPTAKLSLTPGNLENIKEDLERLLRYSAYINYKGDNNVFYWGRRFDGSIHKLITSRLEFEIIEVEDV